MKFKNIEDVWAYAKNKLVNAQISSIQKTGSSKFFDITIPKVMVKKYPEGLSSKRNLDYTISETAGEIECILEQTGDISTIVDTSDFFDSISAWCGINESQEMNQNAIIGIEDSDISGFDKMILFSYYSSRSELENQLKKVGKPYKLNVLPSDEAEIHVKSSDVDKFKSLITALREKIETGMNMIMMEGITIKGRPLPDKFKSDFDNTEKSFIDSVIGKTWYQITPKSKAYKEIDSLVAKSKKSSSKNIAGISYTVYTAPKGTPIILLDAGYGSECYIVGEANINESEAQDKYREFFENKLKQWNVSSPSELTQEDRSKFFTEIRNEWKSQKTNESFNEGGYEILTQAEFRNDFSGEGDFASYALQLMHNPRLFVKCTTEHPNYSKIRAFVETLPEVENTDYNDNIKQYRQTDSNMIIIYNDNIYWSYNTGTNLVLLNEAELVKGIGKIFDTLPEVGKLSDNAVRSAIEQLEGTMSGLALDPSTNSIKAYKNCEDTYQCLKAELAKRGLQPR